MIAPTYKPTVVQNIHQFANHSNIWDFMKLWMPPLLRPFGQSTQKPRTTWHQKCLAPAASPVGYRGTVWLEWKLGILGGIRHGYNHNKHDVWWLWGWIHCGCLHFFCGRCHASQRPSRQKCAHSKILYSKHQQPPQKYILLWLAFTSCPQLVPWKVPVEEWRVLKRLVLEMVLENP